MRTGILAELQTQEQLLVAVRRLVATGYRAIDTYTPWPVKGLDEALSLKRSGVARDVLIAGLFGAAFAYWLQWYVNAVNYPLIVGSRPPHAAPAFIPITFETTVLFAGATAFLSALVRSGLPRLWDPVFEVDGFERAYVDRFWISVDTKDPHFDPDRIRETLESLGALRVVQIREARRR